MTKAVICAGHAPPPREADAERNEEARRAHSVDHLVIPLPADVARPHLLYPAKPKEHAAKSSQLGLPLSQGR